MEATICTVTQVNQYIKGVLEAAEGLDTLLVRGELSNYKMYPSGHHYFSLKDSESSLRCVMFRGAASKLRFRPENGMRVIAGGRISVFPRDGAYQLYCAELTPDGVGDLHVAFEQLKAKLYAEGLFRPEHKKPLPAYPQRIAIITSSAGAAVHDMIRILRKRYPLAKVLLLPVRVQGAEAPPEIVGAIRYANRWRLADVIITGRGGGSMEDLWAFNDERVARAIFESELPVISAVGHEPDVTIADFVADVRAATPSNAAELAVPDREELRQILEKNRSYLLRMQGKQLEVARARLQALTQRRVMQNALTSIEDKRVALDYVQKNLVSAMQKRIAAQRQQFVRLTASLDALSPLRVLGRGYAIVRDSAGGILKDASTTQVGDEIDVSWRDSGLHCTVRSVKQEGSYDHGSEAEL